MTNTLNTPVEALEYVYPFRVVAYHLRENSGGAGLYRGGAGIVRAYTFLAPATVTINSERRINAPYGLRGGGVGAVGINRLIRDGREHVLSGKVSFKAQTGDCLVIETPSGGGWGRADS